MHYILSEEELALKNLVDSSRDCLSILLNLLITNPDVLFSSNEGASNELDNANTQLIDMALMELLAESCDVTHSSLSTPLSASSSQKHPRLSPSRTV